MVIVKNIDAYRLIDTITDQNTDTQYFYNVDSLKKNNVMNNIRFKIDECDGYFVAESIDYAIVTQSKTWLGLIRNIDEAVRVHFNLTKNDEFILGLEITSEVLPLVRKSAKVKGHKL